MPPKDTQLSTSIRQSNGPIQQIKYKKIDKKTTKLKKTIF
jgi:hypothetical protein